MENQSFFTEGAQHKSEALPFDFKRVLFRALRYWYVIAGSLAIAFSIAFFNNRYSLRVYPVAASIIIKESQESGGAELLYNNALINQYRNYLNEPYIIRSFPLIHAVVEDLNYDVTIYREGRLQTTDAYGFVPVSVKLIRNKPLHPGTYVFKVLSETQFSFQPLEETNASSVQKFNFGDTISYGGNSAIVNVKPETPGIKQFINVPFLFSISDTDAITSSYASRLGVTWAEQGSGVINLTLNGANVIKEINFLEGLINSYQQNDLNKKNQTAVNTIDFISKEIKSLSDSMRVVEGRLQLFKNVGQSADLGDRVNTLLEKFEAIEKEKSEFLIRENYYSYLKTYLNNGANLDQIILPSSMGISDPVIADLLVRLEKTQFEIKLGKELKKEGNPLLMDKQLRINQIKKDILEAINTLQSTDKIKIDLINRQLKTVETQLNDLPSQERQYVSIKRNYSLMENLYIFLMQKLSEAKISRASNAPDIIIVNAPRQTGGAITPKTGQNYSVAVVLGLLIPFLLFGAAEFFNDRVQSKEDIDKISSIPFIGGIGHSKDVGNLIVQDKPKSSISESFRSLRSNLNFFTSNQDKKVFLVSSSISGEGKTFTTLNLASVLAMSGKKTLIIGADMRRPKLFGDFDLRNDVGLSTYLSGLNTLEDIVLKTPFPNLYLISGGPVPPNPSELLMNAQMAQAMKTLSDQFDYIVIDTPPIALVTDGFVLSQYADHSIFLVRQNFTPKTLLKNVEDLYRSGRLKNISLVLNDIYKTGAGYGYEYDYGYGYGYGNKKKNAAYYDEGPIKS